MYKVMTRAILAAALATSSLFVAAAEPQPAPPPQMLAAVEQSKVNINTADAETLARELSGVGAAKARAITEYRDAHGAFQSVDELLEVKGIGVAILERNLNKLSID